MRDTRNISLAGSVRAKSRWSEVSAGRLDVSHLFARDIGTEEALVLSCVYR